MNIIGIELPIHKDPEDFRFHQLRPILLFDIEANLNNKHLGKLYIGRSEELGALAPKQHRNRKG